MPVPGATAKDREGRAEVGGSVENLGGCGCVEHIVAHGYLQGDEHHRAGASPEDAVVAAQNQTQRKAAH